MTDLQERLEGIATNSWPKPREGFSIIRNCGCWIVNLPQGKAVLPCAGHQATVLKAIE